MAETCNRAFGRYLKALRERRRMSLDDVYSLSQTFPETINKGYLSRCENGHHRLAFSKVIALSRIYEVPADVLVERMELDMELDRLGGPVTEGMTYSELTLAGKKALDEGFKWVGYAYLRDAVPRARIDPVRSTFRDSREQRLIAFMSCATAAIALGRTRFPLHEFQYIKSTGQLSPRHFPILLERLSVCQSSLNHHDAAKATAERAVSEAESLGDPYVLGYVYSNRAHIATVSGDPSVSVDFNQKAYRCFRAAGETYECGRILHNLAHAYFDLRRFGAARRALHAAENTMLPITQNRTLALGRMLLGRIEAHERRPNLAKGHWMEAVAISKRLHDKVLRFKAEFLLYKLASCSGDRPVARSLHRRLKRLSPWLPADTPELQEFKQMAS